MSKKSDKVAEDIEEKVEQDIAQEVEEQEVEETEAQEEKSEKDPQEKIVELQNAVLRARADFDNFRKRTQRDLADARAYSKMSTVEEILPIFDTFKMAMQAANMDNADLNTLLAGLNMIQNQFVQSFDAMGVSEVNAVGQEFDPNLHEAVVEQFSEEIEAGKVISQQRSGYKMGEKLIRAATVVVSKGPEPEAEEETEEVAEES
ncbi:MAG: nucleotide exchange factor GrpE [Lentisphaerales bacterium]|nr:nucleotide exchange factor GrpE [Lentisphaerales bacterium]